MAVIQLITKLFIFLAAIPDMVAKSAFITAITGEALLQISEPQIIDNSGQITGSNFWDLMIKVFAPIASGVIVVQLNKFFDQKRKK